MVAVTALVVLLCVSYVAVGGIVYYVIKMTKDTQASGTELTDTAGNTLHVMSTAATATTSALSALDTDNVFADLVSATLPIGGTLVNLKISGHARASTESVILFTTSSAIPTLVLNGTNLFVGPGASATVLALLGNASSAAVSAGGDGGARALASACAGTGECQSYVSAAGSANKRCPAGAFYAPAQARCLTCPPGRYRSCTGTAKATDSCHNATSCAQMPPGHYATLMVDAAAGSSAWYTIPKYGANDLTPLAATSIIYLSAGVQALAPCPPGTFNAGDRSFCTFCAASAGSYCGAGEASTAGRPCPPGSFCTGRFASPALCTAEAVPYGEYCAGGSAANRGTACPPGGLICLGGARLPVAPCAAAPGAYCQAVYMPTAVACPEHKFCPGGFFSLASPAPCSGLPAGYWCPQGSASAAGAPCPAGRFCAGGASAAPVDCTAAPGYFCPSAASSLAGEACPLGHSCAGGTAAPVLTACRSGSAGSACAPCTADRLCHLSSDAAPYTFATSARAVGINAQLQGPAACAAYPGYTARGAFCGACPPGHTCSAAAFAAPQPCSAGFCAAGTPAQGAAALQYTVSTCPPGTRALTAATSLGGAPVSACVNCAAGTFSATAGAAQCTQCASGRASDAGAQACAYTPLTCPIGTFYDPAALACRACGDGAFGGGPGLLACTSAVAGYFAASSNGVTPAAFDAPARGMAAQLRCADGTFSAAAGSAACAPCARGFYSSAAEGGLAGCKACPAGRSTAGSGLGVGVASCAAA